MAHYIPIMHMCVRVSAHLSSLRITLRLGTRLHVSPETAGQRCSQICMSVETQTYLLLTITLRCMFMTADLG